MRFTTRDQAHHDRSDRPCAGRRGFTLIELLMVVVVIGLLASIVLLRSTAMRRRAVIASMKSDLRNLATAQEAYFADFGAYTDIAGLTAPPPRFAFSGTTTGSITVMPGAWHARFETPDAVCTLGFNTGTADDGVTACS